MPVWILLCPSPVASGFLRKNFDRPIIQRGRLHPLFDRKMATWLLPTGKMFCKYPTLWKRNWYKTVNDLEHCLSPLHPQNQQRMIVNAVAAPRLNPNTKWYALVAVFLILGAVAGAVVLSVSHNTTAPVGAPSPDEESPFLDSKSPLTNNVESPFLNVLEFLVWTRPRPLISIFRTNP